MVNPIFTDDDRNLITEVFVLIDESGADVAQLFYKALFEKHPALRRLFPKDLAGQVKKFSATLRLLPSFKDDVKLEWALVQFGVVHADFKKDDLRVEEEHFGPVGEILLGVFRQALGASFTTAHEAALSKRYNWVAAAMKKGLCQARKEAGTVSATTAPVAGTEVTLPTVDTSGGFPIDDAETIVSEPPAALLAETRKGGEELSTDDDDEEDIPTVVRPMSTPPVQPTPAS